MEVVSLYLAPGHLEDHGTESFRLSAIGSYLLDQLCLPASPQLFLRFNCDTGDQGVDPVRLSICASAVEQDASVPQRHEPELSVSADWVIVVEPGVDSREDETCWIRHANNDRAVVRIPNRTPGVFHPDVDDSSPHVGRSPVRCLERRELRIHERAWRRQDRSKKALRRDLSAVVLG
jgi:hypothetical protein